MFFDVFDEKVTDNAIKIPFSLDGQECRVYCMKDVENIVFVQIWKKSDIKKAEENEKDFEVLSFFDTVINEKKFILPEEFLKYIGEEIEVRISGVVDYIDILKKSDFKDMDNIDELLDF